MSAPLRDTPPGPSESQVMEWADGLRERADWSDRVVSTIFWAAFLTAAGFVLARCCFR